MDERTQRDLAALKELRHHLQLEKELPQKIKSSEAAWKKSIERSKVSIEADARNLAKSQMTYQMPDKKKTDHAEKLNVEITKRISDAWSKKDDVHTGILSAVKVLATVGCILILIAIHAYIGWNIYHQIVPVFAPALTLHPNHYTDIATNKGVYLMFAIGHMVISLGINIWLLRLINKIGKGR